MKLGNRQMEVVEQCILRRIRAKYQAELDEKRKAYSAMAATEKAEFTAAVQKKHAKVFQKLDTIREQIKALDDQRVKLTQEMEGISGPLMEHFEFEHFEFGHTRQPNFDLPRFKPSEKLRQLEKDIDSAAKKANSISQQEIDEVVLRITLADAPELKAILAEYHIELP